MVLISRELGGGPQGFDYIINNWKADRIGEVLTVLHELQTEAQDGSSKKGKEVSPEGLIAALGGAVERE